MPIHQDPEARQSLTQDMGRSGLHGDPDMDRRLSGDTVVSADEGEKSLDGAIHNPEGDFDRSRIPMELPRLVTKIHDFPREAEQFFGRKDYLDDMHERLFGPDSERHHHLAIWGTQGIGKRELVLKFALDHLQHYDIIKWFNADNEQRLKSQIESFYDTLSSEKARGLKNVTPGGPLMKHQAALDWLQEQDRVLLVYTDANAKSGVFSVPNYFPHRCKVHRIVIGSSSSTCLLANSWIEVKKMPMEEAVDMFCGQANISGEDQQDPKIMEAIRQIVNEADCKPFHLDHASTEYRDGGHGPLSFLAEIQRQKEDLSLEGSHLLTGDGAYLWRITFDRIKDSHPDSLMLLYLFTYLDGSDISSKLIGRFHGLSWRWSEAGNEMTRTAKEDGVHPELIDLLCDEERFRTALRPLLDATIIRRRDNSRGGLPNAGWRIEMSPLDQDSVARMMPDADRLYWTKQVIRLMSHAVPEDRVVEPGNREKLWPYLTPHVLRCMRLANGFAEQRFAGLVDVQGPLVSMLLSSLESLECSDNQGILALVDDLLESGFRGTVAQRCKAAKWRAYNMFYVQKLRERAEELLGRTQHTEQITMGDWKQRTPLNNAAMADVLVHRAQLLSGLGKNERAIKVLESWNMEPRSRIELRAKRLNDTALYKYLALSRGDVPRAIEGLAAIHAMARPRGPIKELEEFNFGTVMLAQLCCQTGDWYRAETVISPTLEKYKSEGRVYEYITGDLRLIYCEALMRLGRYGDYDHEIAKLEEDLRHPEQNKNTRAPQQLLGTRRSRARSLYRREQWARALDAWRLVLQELKLSETTIASQPDLLRDSTEETYAKAETIYSLAVTYWRLGDMASARKYRAMVEVHPASLQRPATEVNYTRWNEYLRDEHACMAAMEEELRIEEEKRAAQEEQARKDREAAEQRQREAEEQRKREEKVRRALEEEKQRRREKQQLYLWRAVVALITLCLLGGEKLLPPDLNGGDREHIMLPMSLERSALTAFWGWVVLFIAAFGGRVTYYGVVDGQWGSGELEDSNRLGHKEMDGEEIIKHEDPA